MIVLLKGYVLYTFGGGALLTALLMFFPQLAMKNAKEYSDETRRSMRKTGWICLPVGIVLILLGFLIKV